MTSQIPPHAMPTEITLAQATTRALESVAAETGLAATSGQIAAMLAPVLPVEAHEALLTFRQARDEGALLIDGVGPGDVPAGAESYTDLPIASALLLGMVALVATPACALEEWDGAAITDIRITAGLEDTVSSKGRLELPVHQETQHLESPPDGLALLMVRGGSPTRIAATRDIIDRLRARDAPAVLDLLREPLFAHRTPDSFGVGGVTEPVPVLLGPDEMPELRVDLATTAATNEAGESALAALAEAARDVAFDVFLSPGRLIMLDNRRWLHGRGELSSTATGRWLVRSLFVCDSWSVQRDRERDAGRGIAVC